MALKHITLCVTRQEADPSGRRKTVRVKVADTDMAEVEQGKGKRNIPLLLTHALSKGGENVGERKGFDYVFSDSIGENSQGGGFVLGEEKEFPYVFGEASVDPNVWSFTLTI